MSARKQRPPKQPQSVPGKEKGLGRLHAPDARDDRFPMRAVVRRIAERDVFRRPGRVLNQGETSSCVGHAWRGWMLAGPTMFRGRQPDEFAIYNRARALDEWPENDNDPDFGTSVRAGAKVMREAGRLAEFVWAESTADVVRFLLTRGPVVLGTDWREGMDEPDSAGIVRATGDARGGHAYLCYGYDKDRKRFRCQNSWGASWGQNGRFWIPRADLELLLDAAGEACGALESPE